MKKRLLYESLGWTKLVVNVAIYQLEWGGKKYVGSSTNLPTRLYWWRTTKLPYDTTVTVLECCSIDERFKREAFWIKKLNTVANGHNKTADGKAGGVAGHATSNETRNRISTALIGKRRTEEHKALMSESAKKRGAHSKEVYEKISNSLKGRKVSEETKQGIAAKLTGKPKSEAHRNALKEAWKRRKERQHAE